MDKKLRRGRRVSPLVNAERLRHALHFDSQKLHDTDKIHSFADICQLCDTNLDKPLIWR